MTLSAYDRIVKDDRRQRIRLAKKLMEHMQHQVRALHQAGVDTADMAIVSGLSMPENITEFHTPYGPVRVERDPGTPAGSFYVTHRPREAKGEIQP